MMCEILSEHIICLKIIKIMEWFGRYSLELYLSHVAIRRVMNILGYHTYRYSYELIMIGLSLIVSVLIKKITDEIQRMVGEKNVTKGCSNC